MDKIPDITKNEPRVVNMGLRSFYESMKDQEVPVIHMDWKPPAGGKKHLLEILKKLK
jgi:hypothetical protein